MAGRIIWEPSRTLHEFRLLPGLTSDACVADRVDLSTCLAARPGGGKRVGLGLPVIGGNVVTGEEDRQ
jgi:hypothetical protein